MPIIIASLLIWMYFSISARVSVTNTLSTKKVENVSNAPKNSDSINSKRALDMIRRAELPVYIPTADLVVQSQPKGGSTSLFQLIFAGVTGLQSFHAGTCKTYVQNFSSPCWRSLVVPLEDARPETRNRLLFGRDDGTLRVAVQRDPFDRVMSAYRDKLACNRNLDEIHREHKKWVVNDLLRTADWDDFKGAQLTSLGDICLTLPEFGTVLSRIQRRLKNGAIKELFDIERHFRPQEYFYNDIHYDIILRVQDLSAPERIQPILKRLPLLEQSGISTSIEAWHTTGHRSADMDDETERKIREFSSLSKWGEPKYI